MADNKDDKPTIDQAPEQTDEKRLGRRLFFFKAAAAISGAAAVTAAVAVGTATEAEAQYCSDRDPYDPRGRGRWCRVRRRRRIDRVCRDRDPRDPRAYRC